MPLARHILVLSNCFTEDDVIMGPSLVLEDRVK